MCIRELLAPTHGPRFEFSSSSKQGGKIKLGEGRGRREGIAQGRLRSREEGLWA